MIHASRMYAACLVAATMLVACTTAHAPAYDTLVNVRSMCDVPFEAGKTVRVSGIFRGDRYHYSFMADPACPGVVWNVDYTDAFRDRYRTTLELGNALAIGPGSRIFRLEVEGVLRPDHEGKPLIEFHKLGNSERIVE